MHYDNKADIHELNLMGFRSCCRKLHHSLLSAAQGKIYENIFWKAQRHHLLSTWLLTFGSSSIAALKLLAEQRFEECSQDEIKYKMQVSVKKSIFL